MKTLAFVGGGPTTIYTLQALIKKAMQPFAITVFEEQNALGRGTPYRPGWNDPAMLSNIASIEIPPLEQTLVDWLHQQSDTVLARLGVERDKIGERIFYPRLVLGEFFHGQSNKLLDRAKRQGIEITVRTRCRVLDVVNQPSGMLLTIRPAKGADFQERFDHVVLATGHQWPATPEIRPGYFLSPWPASNLAKIPPCDIGVRGTSLTAIDATVALAGAHGEFAEKEEGRLDYKPAPGTGTFHITMMSRKGLLPEADFYAPIPYQPLAMCTEEAVDALIADDDGDLLDRAFALFKRELTAADPQYTAEIDLKGIDLAEFHDRYFAPRANRDAFAWAAQNLGEAQANYARKVTVPWRYAILRMHEVMERLVPYLEAQDYERFSRYFKPVFVDDYATVPHKSIKRMLALHAAGKLDILAIGDKYRIDTYRAEGGATVEYDGQVRSFDVFIEAMGQTALPAKDFPFPSLIRQGIIHDYVEGGEKKPTRGIAIDDAFHPISDAIPADRLFCLSLPFILGRHPFHQGITSSHAMGTSVAEDLAAVINRDREVGETLTVTA
jgi:uncharacterized NAD(P)/FAD-binding protein YdhS